MTIRRAGSAEYAAADKQDWGQDALLRMGRNPHPALSQSRRGRKPHLVWAAG